MRVASRQLSPDLSKDSETPAQEQASHRCMLLMTRISPTPRFPKVSPPTRKKRETHHKIAQTQTLCHCDADICRSRRAAGRPLRTSSCRDCRVADTPEAQVARAQATPTESYDAPSSLAISSVGVSTGVSERPSPNMASPAPGRTGTLTDRTCPATSSLLGIAATAAVRAAL